jgi:peptidoglycan hydrolase CwlO-like protein
MPSLPENTPLWLTVLVFAFMAVMVFLQTRSTTKVGSADATEKIGRAYDQLLENMNERLQKLELKLKKLEKWVPMLIDQIYSLGGVPLDPPDTDELYKK